ncbi:hypothetical protein ACFIOY_34560 [Bradyrhizobium sp. TZ2]
MRLIRGTFSEVMNGVISDDRPIAPDLVLATKIVPSLGDGSHLTQCR